MALLQISLLVGPRCGAPQGGMGDEDEAFTASEIDEDDVEVAAGDDEENSGEAGLGDLDEQEAADFLRAAEEGDVAGIQIVKDQPDLLDVQDDLGNSALHLAVLGAHIECARELIAAGAELDALNDEGNTALILSTICMAEGAGDCAKLLVESGADPEIQNLQGCRAIHYACGEGNMPVVEYLVKGAKVDVRAVSNDMLTPLLCAMINNRGSVSSLLIRHDPGLLAIADSNGDFPLHFAVLERLADMVEILLQEGADPLVTTSRGETPLMVAVDVQAEEEIVAQLQQAEREARARTAVLAASECEAEAEVLAERGEVERAVGKWREAEALYREAGDDDDAQSCDVRVQQALGGARSSPLRGAGGGAPGEGVARAGELEVREGGAWARRHVSVTAEGALEVHGSEAERLAGAAPAHRVGLAGSRLTHAGEEAGRGRVEVTGREGATVVLGSRSGKELLAWVAALEKAAGQRAGRAGRAGRAAGDGAAEERAFHAQMLSETRAADAAAGQLVAAREARRTAQASSADNSWDSPGSAPGESPLREASPEREAADADADPEDSGGDEQVMDPGTPPGLGPRGAQRADGRARVSERAVDERGRSGTMVDGVFYTDDEGDDDDDDDERRRRRRRRRRRLRRRAAARARARVNGPRRRAPRRWQAPRATRRRAAAGCCGSCSGGRRARRRRGLPTTHGTPA